MRHVFSLFLFASIVVLPACTLPKRDNPSDPANAPLAALRIVDLETGEGVVAASRGHRLALDASGTRDPQGQSMSYEFFVVDSSGTASSIPSAGETPMAELDDDFRHSVQPGSILRFRVIVTDDSGGVGQAEVSGTLLNAVPIAVAPASRTLPRGGFPWSPGTPFQVKFDPSATRDPDGEVDRPYFRYCWTFSPELSTTAQCPAQPTEVCSSDSADPAFVRCVDSVRATAVRGLASLVVSDAEGSDSLTARTTVTIGAQNLWLGSGVDLGNYERFDVARQSFPGFVNSGSSDTVGLFLGGPTVSRIVTASENGASVDLALGEWPRVQVLDAFAIPANDFELAGAPAGDAFWTVARVSSNPELRVRRWSLGAGSNSLVPGPEALLASPGVFFSRARMAIDPAGTAWISVSLTATGYTLGSNGQSAPLLPDADHVFAGLAARPASNEIWTLEVADWVQGGPAVPTRIVRHEGALAPVAFDIPLGQAQDLHWASANELWLVTADEGLLLLDVQALEGGATFDQAVLSRLPDLFPGYGRLAVDPARGDLYGSDVIARLAYRARRSGDLTYFPFVSDKVPVPLFVDAEGALFYQDRVVNPSVLVRGNSPSESGAVETIGVIGQFRAGPNLQTGGLWAPGLFPPILLHVAEDGTLLSSVTSVISAGSTTPTTLPILIEFRLDPDGAFAWGIPIDLSNFQPGSLYRFDLSTNPPVSTLVLGSAQVRQFAQNGSSTIVLEPSAPVPGVTPFLWTALRVTPTPTSAPTPTPTPPTRLRLTGVDGTSTVVFSIPGTEVRRYTFGSAIDFDMAAARSLGSNALCVATVVDDLGANRFVRVRRVQPSGSVQTLGQLPLPTDPGTPGAPCSSYDLRGVAAVIDPASGKDICWVALHDQCVIDASTVQTRFVAFDSTGTLFRQYTEPGRPYSFAAVSPTRIAASMSPANFDAPNVRVILDDPDGVSFRREEMIGERATFITHDAH